VASLRSAGYSDYEIGTHAGLADTSLALAVDKSLVRAAALADTAQQSKRDGVYGDPHRATVQLGQIGVAQIVQTSVKAIQGLTHAR
jgi:creatinine amidohydrolase/Fe(II)-dependent formamide hydrolase-like protein